MFSNKKRKEINMATKVEKYPPIPEERLKKYRDLWENSRSSDGIPPEVATHLARIKRVGGEQIGIETVGDLNKDYLGAFMAPWSRDLEYADIAIVGCCLEKAAPMNASHKYGPWALRQLSKFFMGTTEPFMGGYDIPFDWCRIIDYGNIDTYGMFDLSMEVEEHIAHFNKIIVEHGVTPFSWGGDHTTSYAPIRALGEHYGPLSLIHFDAHYDLVTYADFPYPYHSGNQFTKNFAEGNLDPQRMIQMGMRGRMSALVGGHPKNFGVTSITAEECREIDPKDMAEKIIEVVADGPVYLSLDLDALDPAFNSASSAVEPFGLTTWWIWDVIKNVRASGKVNLVGGDVVEYAPAMDPTSKDGYQAVGLSWKILCWLAAEVKRRNGEERPTEWPHAFGSLTL
jgi:arginase family enzyme